MNSNLISFSITTASWASVRGAAAGPPGLAHLEAFPQAPVPLFLPTRHRWTLKILSQNNRSETEVVRVSGLAREGVNFFSCNQYGKRASIEMAIPYTSKAPNVLSLVRIVGLEREKPGTEFPAAYLA